jgi:hypothetical protein
MRSGDVLIEVDAPALTIFFAFPREQEITANRGVAEFFAHIGPLKVRTRFRLDSMVRGGKLDL